MMSVWEDASGAVRESDEPWQQSPSLQRFGRAGRLSLRITHHRRYSNSAFLSAGCLAKPSKLPCLGAWFLGLAAVAEVDRLLCAKDPRAADGLLDIASTARWQMELRAFEHDEAVCITSAGYTARMIHRAYQQQACAAIPRQVAVSIISQETSSSPVVLAVTTVTCQLCFPIKPAFLTHSPNHRNEQQRPQSQQEAVKQT